MKSDTERVDSDKGFGKAAKLIGSLINKSTHKDFKMFPFFVYHREDSGDTKGVMFVSNQDGSAFIISEGKGKLGLVGGLAYFKSHDSEIAEFTLTSTVFPIVKLVDEFARLVSDQKYAKSIHESVNERQDLGQLTQAQIDEVSLRFSKGESAAKISRELDIPYKYMAIIKRNVHIPEVGKPTPMVQHNQQTLEDKVLYLNEMLEDVYDISRKVAAGAFNSLFISGKAGTGKTFNVEKGLKDEGLREDQDYFKMSGSISVLEMYKKLFQYSDKLLVFDDCDSVFKDEAGRNILKAALDTKKIRRISYMKRLGMLFDPKDFEDDEEEYVKQIDDGLIPNYFEFKGQVIFISNLKKDVADPDGAIRSRSILIDINPDDATLMERMRALLPTLEPTDMALADKEEIFEFMKNSQSVSMRTFVKAAGFKMSGLSNWKRMAERYV
jgi:hypothetical protein